MFCILDICIVFYKYVLCFALMGHRRLIFSVRIILKHFKIYITINNITGEKTINLSYPIRDFDSGKEIAVISMLSDNVQYEMTEPLGLKLIDGSENRY